MVVITNGEKKNGVVVALHKDIRDAIRSKIGDFYLIPVTVDEMLAVAKNKSGTAERIKELFLQTNDADIPAESRLSDNIYEEIDGELQIVK